MVERYRSQRRIMRAFKINELSAVDRPAQEHARRTIIKRSGGDYGEFSDLIKEVQALDFNAVMAEEESREAAMRVKDGVWRRWHALQQSFETIASDEEVSPADKVKSMQDSLRQFIASLSEEGDEIGKAVIKSISAVPALAELLTKDGTAEGDDPMTAAEKKQFEELQKMVEDLTKKLEAATAGDDVAKTAAEAVGLKKQLEEATAKVDEMTKAAEAAAAEKEEAVAKASMSDSEKEYMASLDKDEQMSFMRMTHDERKARMKKSETSDPVVYKSDRTGEEFRKSDDPRLVKYAKQADEDAKIAREERERRETSELTKRAEHELDNFAGEVADKAEVLRAIDKMDEAPRQLLTDMLQTGGKAIQAAFKTVGHRGGDAAKSGQDFEKRVTEVQARDRVSRTEAMKRAAREFPEEHKVYQDGGAAVN